MSQPLMPLPATPAADAATALACSHCNLRNLCLPAGLSAADIESIGGVVQARRKVARGAALFRTGQPFSSLHAVRTGFFKTTVSAPDGRDQVTAFSMAGDVLGLDAIQDGVHACDAVALEDSEVCVLPYARLQELAREVPALQAQVHRALSREIVRDHGVMLLLGSMTAEERVATFLLSLTHRLSERGFSPSELVLRMTRAEIGSYLGVQLETVSRTLSRFVAEGMIEVRMRHLRIVDAAALAAVVANVPCNMHV